MSLIVEDGSLVENANSLVSRAEYIAYAASIGVIIADSVDTDYELIKAMNFINSYEGKLKGTKVSRTQGTAFPRYQLVIDGWSWTSTEIPTKAKNCQMEFALTLNSGVDLYNPSFSKGPRIEETVSGAVTVKYAVNSVMASRTSYNSFELLKSLLKSSNSQSIQLVRA